jgi:hypothetical protein
VDSVVKDLNRFEEGTREAGMTNRRYGFWTSLVAVAVLLLTATPSRAMEIERFEAMSTKDQSRYFAELISGSECLSRDAHQEEMARKLVAAFSGTQPPVQRLAKGHSSF